ncbi:hypothetical protein [Corynebacterium camporealensis]
MEDEDYRIAILEAGLRIGGTQGDEAITIPAVASASTAPEEAIRNLYYNDEILQQSVIHYIEERPLGYIQEAFAATPPVGEVIDRFLNFAEGYFAYYFENPELFNHLFEKHTFLSQASLIAARENKEETGDAEIDVLMHVARQFVALEGFEVGKNISSADLAHQAIAVWGTIHGMGFLSTWGVLRHQHRVARHYNFREVIRTMFISMRHQMEVGAPSMPDPCFETLRKKVQDIHAAEVPEVTGEKLQALPDDVARNTLRLKAVTLASQEGPEVITIPRIAKELDVPEGYVRSLAGNDYLLRESAEVQSDLDLQNVLRSISATLPDDASCEDRLRALGVGYFYYAVNYPDRFKGVMALANRSVMPTGGGTVHQGIAPSLADLMQTTRECIEERGIEPDDQMVYVKTLGLWAGATGLGHLCGAGTFRYLDDSAKWTLFAEVVEKFLDSFNYALTYEQKDESRRG